MEDRQIPADINATDGEQIKSILLTTHHKICTEIIFLLLCGKRQDKWTSLTEEFLMNDVLCSAENIFKQLTA